MGAQTFPEAASILTAIDVIRDMRILVSDTPHGIALSIALRDTLVELDMLFHALSVYAGEE